MPSFSDLLELHRQLDEMLLEHQRGLLRFELDRAEVALDEYAAALRAHIRDEETFLIPLYSARVTAPIGGASEIFLREHQKLSTFLDLFRQEMARIRAMDDVERGILFLIDSQYLFKRLLVHHDMREEKFLYPLLDQMTTEAERARLFDRLTMPPNRAARRSMKQAG